MTDKKEKKGFSEVVSAAPIEKTEEIKQSINNGQSKLFEGLTQEQADITLHNMKLLAPLDKYTIAGETYERRMQSPQDIRDIKKKEREYMEELQKVVRDPEKRLELDFDLLLFKAGKYLGMTLEQFNKTDLSHLQIVLEACELRTQGFRRL